MLSRIAFMKYFVLNFYAPTNRSCACKHPLTLLGAKILCMVRLTDKGRGEGGWKNVGKDRLITHLQCFVENTLLLATTAYFCYFKTQCATNAHKN